MTRTGELAELAPTVVTYRAGSLQEDAGVIAVLRDSREAPSTGHCRSLTGTPFYPLEVTIDDEVDARRAEPGVAFRVAHAIDDGALTVDDLTELTNTNITNHLAPDGKSRAPVEISRFLAAGIARGPGRTP